tara:strand:- start:1177 stop:1722 length:546 start_codon:yes stop_codon:yes gene_type:complete
MKMLNFQNQDCNLSLQEGIDEYRSYLRKNNRYVLGEQASDSEKWGILCHDATHVIFGLDSTLEEEAMLDCWVFFGGNYFQILKDYLSGKITFKETTEKVEILLKDVGYSKYIYLYLKVMVKKWPVILFRCFKMKKRWNYYFSKELLDKSIKELRNEFRIMILSSSERKIKKVSWSREIKES